MQQDNEIRGYVVRGKDHQGNDRAAWNSEGATCAPHAATEWKDASFAVIARTRLGDLYRIYAVDAAGAETPWPNGTNDKGRVTDEELAEILRPGEGAAIEMLTGEMMGVRDPEGDGDHYDAYQEIAAPLVRRERALAAEVGALREQVKALVAQTGLTLAAWVNHGTERERFLHLAAGKLCDAGLLGERAAFPSGDPSPAGHELLDAVYATFGAPAAGRTPDDADGLASAHEAALSPAARAGLEAGLTSARSAPPVYLGSFAEPETAS